MAENKFFKFKTIPSTGLDPKIMLEQIGSDSFAILYDLNHFSTSVFINTDNPDEEINIISSVSEGTEFRKSDDFSFSNTNIYLFYKSSTSISDFLFSDIFSIGVRSGILGIVFCPIKNQSIEVIKNDIERILGSIPNRSNSTWRNFITFGHADSTSFQHDIFERSEELTMLKEALEQINISIINNGFAYKISILTSTEKEYEKRIYDYIKSKVLVLGEKHMGESNINKIISFTESSKMIPFGNYVSGALIRVYGDYSLKYIINSKAVFSDNGIKIGSIQYAGGRIIRDIRIPINIFNLGFIISGLPGSGKTSEARGIISQMTISPKKPLMAVLSPTTEWSDFSEYMDMNVIKLCSDGYPINFFLPPRGVNIKKFYQDLSLLLASASESGPYQKPLEKCLINAFRRYYSSHKIINPAELFLEIQESIIELHGNRTNTGVKYTKHGENIKSALENLIEILQFPEYSDANANGIEDLLVKGVVFDVSAVSVQMKTFFYALILNQLYSIASKFDVYGDSELRMLICIEEAQLLFKDPKSATVEDIRSRIQDFRKLGVGLMLLVHSITDIDQDIRRLCQLKIYLKQPTDVAKKAAEDLVFTGTEEEAIITKLKHLESGYGALNYILEDSNTKINPDTIFIQTIKYNELVKNPILQNQQSKYKNQNVIKQHKNKYLCNSNITVSFNESKKLPSYIRLSYLNTFIIEIPVSSSVVTFKHKLIKSKIYSLDFLSSAKKMMKRVEFESGREIKIEL